MNAEIHQMYQKDVVLLLVGIKNVRSWPHNFKSFFLVDFILFCKFEIFNFSVFSKVKFFLCSAPDPVTLSCPSWSCPEWFDGDRCKTAYGLCMSIFNLDLDDNDIPVMSNVYTHAQTLNERMICYERQLPSLVSEHRVFLSLMSIFSFALFHQIFC